jgi:hypothetical protein
VVLLCSDARADTEAFLATCSDDERASIKVWYIDHARHIVELLALMGDRNVRLPSLTSVTPQPEATEGGSTEGDGQGEGDDLGHALLEEAYAEGGGVPVDDQSN